MQVEQYVHNARIEVDLVRALVDTAILPAALQDIGELCKTVDKLLSLVERLGGPLSTAPGQERLRALSYAVGQLHEGRKALDAAVEAAEASEHHALGFGAVVPALWQVRRAADRLEELVTDSLWPLPKYRELLFLA